MAYPNQPVRGSIAGHVRNLIRTLNKVSLVERVQESVYYPERHYVEVRVTLTSGIEVQVGIQEETGNLSIDAIYLHGAKVDAASLATKLKKVEEAVNGRT